MLIQGTVSALPADSIFVNRRGALNFTSHTGRTLSFNEVKQQVKATNEPAFDVLQSAQSGRAIAAGLGFAGGALIGYPLGMALAGGKAEWVLAGAGIALVAISVPVNAAANKKAREAISVYNEGIGAVVAHRIQPQCIVGFTGNGIGLTLKF